MALFLYDVSASASDTDRTSCLAKLKTQVDTEGSLLVAPDGAVFDASLQKFEIIAPVVDAKNVLSTEYDVDYPDGDKNISDIEKKTIYKGSNSLRVLTTTISQERRSDTFYKLEVSEELLKNQANSENENEIVQEFDVTNTCELKLYRTTISTSQIDQSVWNSTKQSFSGPAPTVGSPITRITKTIPNDGFLLFDLEDQTPAEALTILARYTGKSGYLLSGDLETPFVSMQVRPSTQTIVNPTTNQTETMQGFKITLQYEGSTVVDSLLASAVSGISLNDDSDTRTWSVSKNLWDQSQIISLDDHQDEIPINYLNDQDPEADIVQLSLKTDAPLNYQNLDMYWQVLSTDTRKYTSESGDSKIEYTKTLQARPPLIYSELSAVAPLSPNVEHDFIGDTASVQTSSPEVHALAIEATGLSKSNDNRLLIAEAITQVLAKHLKYDYSAIESGGSIEEYSTAEIIRKQSGTCNNFANVFTAVARSLRIPARMIVGLNLNEDIATFHAWVEVETKESVWIPFDPQSTMDRFTPQNYVPLGVEALDTDLDPASQALFDVQINPTVLNTQYRN